MSDQARSVAIEQLHAKERQSFKFGFASLAVAILGVFIVESGLQMAGRIVIYSAVAVGFCMLFRITWLKLERWSLERSTSARSDDAA